MNEHRNSLRPGYSLHWYLIKEVLGHGGFGITYLAQDTNLDQLVAIKEYLPVEMAVRSQDDSIHPVSGEYGEQFSWGLDRFISEAQTLAKFKHPNIVRVFTVFPENNTAYMVMEYEQGKGLHEILKEKKTLSEGELKEIVLPILDGLDMVHKAGFIHRDIKPPNIFIREDGTPVLLDFGSARQALVEQTRTLTTLISPGFAPFEQYVSKSDKQGPWTDIYGLGATLYRAVVGRSPAEAMDRSESLLHTSRDSYVGTLEIKPQGYSEPFLQAIDRALAFKGEDRPQTITAWREQLTSDTVMPDFAEVATTVADPEHSATKIVIDTDNTKMEAAAGKPTHKGRYFIKRMIQFAVLLFCLLLVLSALKNAKRRNEAAVAANVKTDAVQIDVVEKSTDSANREGDIPPENVISDKALSDTQIPFPQNDIVPLISDRDKRQLARIKKRLQKNPDDENAKRRLRNLINGYEARVRQAIADKDYQRAENYVQQMFEFAPDNKRLNEALKNIKNMKEE